MTTLVIAEHDNVSIKSATRNTITAAAELGAEITLLVVGTDCQAAANEAASIAGVAKVLVADCCSLRASIARSCRSAYCPSGEQFYPYSGARYDNG